MAILDQFTLDDLRNLPSKRYVPGIPKRNLVGISEDYPEYFKDVSHLNKIDIYTVHQLFNIQDPSGCIHHASKKLLLSGSRNGGKSKYQDIKEARDSLNRWLALNQGDDSDKVH